MPFIRAVEVAAVTPGSSAPVFLDDRWVVVCNDAGRFHACDHDCPHAGGALSSGPVEDGKIICPVHHWPWDLTTGKTAEEWGHMRLRCYAVEVRDGGVYVDVDQVLNDPLTEA